MLHLLDIFKNTLLLLFPIRLIINTSSYLIIQFFNIKLNLFLLFLNIIYLLVYWLVLLFRIHILNFDFNVFELLFQWVELILIFIKLGFFFFNYCIVFFNLACEIWIIVIQNKFSRAHLTNTSCVSCSSSESSYIWTKFRGKRSLFMKTFWACWTTTKFAKESFICKDYYQLSISCLLEVISFLQQLQYPLLWARLQGTGEVKWNISSLMSNSTFCPIRLTLNVWFIILLRISSAELLT
jgi:hypothetical protein